MATPAPINPSKSDIALLGDGSFTLDPDSFGPFGVRGADKVAQRFLYALFTPAGSVAGRPKDGTDFLRMISSFASEFDVFAAFASCEPKAVTTVKSYESTTDPAADRIDGAALAVMEFTAGLLTLTFKVATMDASQPTQVIDYTLEA